MRNHSTALPTGRKLEAQLTELEDRVNDAAHIVADLAEGFEQSEAGVNAADYGRLRTTMLELSAVARDEILAHATAILDGLDEAHFGAWRLHAAR